MKKILKALLIFVAVIAIIYGALWVWVLIPSPEFEPHAYEPLRPDYWPTDGFRTSTPEEQGMDSEKLLEIHDFYANQHEKNAEYSIDSIAVYRNGYLVADYYFNPLYPRDTPHVIHSETKSIMSALIGIAIEQGHIESVDVPYVAFFPDKQAAITDERMKAITLRDLLSMETGIRSRDFALYRWEGNFAMQQTDGYGYQWWLDKDGSYSAVGVGGQYIMVVPEENLLVVVTNASSGLGVFFPRKILDKYILPAIMADEAIAANETAYRELAAKSGPPELVSQPQAVAELPSIAVDISSEIYSVAGRLPIPSRSTINISAIQHRPNLP